MNLTDFFCWISFYPYPYHHVLYPRILLSDIDSGISLNLRSGQKVGGKTKQLPQLSKKVTHCQQSKEFIVLILLREETHS